MVGLTKLARRFVADHDARLKGRGLVVEVGAEPTALDWRPLGAVLVEAVCDDESYVFLAAAHALAAVADAVPAEVLPWLREAFETAADERRKLRLGEALMLSIRRRGEAAPAYARGLGRAFCAGARPERPARDRCACLSCLAELLPLVQYRVQNQTAFDLRDARASAAAPRLVSAEYPRGSRGGAATAVAISRAPSTHPPSKTSATSAAQVKDVTGWGLDALDLATRGLGEAPETRRAAAFLGAAVVATDACLEAHPRETAKLCKALKRLTGDADAATAGHCAAAMARLDVLLARKVKGADPKESALERLVKMDLK